MKWQTVSLAYTISANPTFLATKCLCKMCTEINKIQHSINSAYYEPIYLRKNIIRACHGYQVLTTSLTNSELKTLDMVNSFCSSIINYKGVYKSSTTENYLQTETNQENNEIFFTNQQYQQNRSLCSWHRVVPLFFPRFSSWLVQHIKKCYIYEKVSYWSTNHIQYECEKLKKKFSNRYCKYKARSGYEKTL